MEDKEMILEPEFKSNEEIRQELILKLINERGFVRYKGFGLLKRSKEYSMFLTFSTGEIIAELVIYSGNSMVRKVMFRTPYPETVSTLLIVIRSGLKGAMVENARKLAEDSLKSLLPYD